MFKLTLIWALALSVLKILAIAGFAYFMLSNDHYSSIECGISALLLGQLQAEVRR